MGEHVAKSGRIYAAASGVINADRFNIADYRGGIEIAPNLTVAEWFGQHTTRQGAVVTAKDFPATINEVAFKPDILASILGCDAVDKAARKTVSAIAQGGTEATLTTGPGADDSFEDNEPVVVADETGYKLEGFIDGAPPSTTSVKVDDGAGAIVSGIDLVGLSGHINGTTQYFTRADNALLDIGNAEDYSILMWFKRDRANFMEVLMSKTSDASGTAYGTTAGWVLFIDADDRLHFAVNDGVDAYIINGATRITDNCFHCVLVTFDESDAVGCVIYLDGYDNTASRTGTLGNIGDCSNALIFVIGAESDGGLPFDGYICESAVYNGSVVSAANALVLACSRMAEPGSPTAWWTFADAAAATVIDDGATAANALDLTLVGGTTTNYGTHSRTQAAFVTANLAGSDYGMENGGIGGWAAGDSASEIRKTTDVKKYGAKSLKIVNGDASQAFARMTIATEADQPYHFQGWFLTPETPNGASQLVNIDETAALGATVTQAGATTGKTWYLVEFDFEAADTSTTVDLGSGSAVSGGIGYWEGIQIFKNYVDAPGFEETVLLSSWAEVSSPTVDDQDTAERSGVYDYEVNGDSSNYVTQDVTLTLGESYTFIGHVKCGTADKAIVVLSGAATATLDNETETTAWVTVRHSFVAATTTLTISIYGNGVDAYFDDFAVIKADWTEYHIDNQLEIPSLQWLFQFTDNDGKINQVYFPSCLVNGLPINFSNLDYVVGNISLLPIGSFVYYVEN